MELISIIEQRKEVAPIAAPIDTPPCSLLVHSLSDQRRSLGDYTYVDGGPR
jgi:hypothetical protein